MVYKILNILSLTALTFLLLIGMYIIYHWTKGLVLMDKLKWVCKHCGETTKSYNQPFCKACSHVERKSIKMEIDKV
tara:strand:+ start:217 stop:444 length:228 start_codon:yes stop_codon:yes gene_type:complete